MEEVISKLDESKSPCPDGIDGKIVKRLHKYLPNSGWSYITNVLHWDVFRKYGKTQG